MGEITAMVIVATIALTIYKLFELFARKKERMAMIEKMTEGSSISQDQLSPLRSSFNVEISNSSWPIRIGLLLVGIGFGVVLAAFIDLNYSPLIDGSNLYHEYKNTINALYPALAAVFGGIGLIIAYFIEKKDRKEDKDKTKE